MNIEQIQREVNRKRAMVDKVELISEVEGDKNNLFKALPLPKSEEIKPKKKKKKKNGEEADEGNETEKTEKSLVADLDRAMERLEKGKFISKKKVKGKWVYKYKEGIKVTKAAIDKKGEKKGLGLNRKPIKLNDAQKDKAVEGVLKMLEGKDVGGLEGKSYGVHKAFAERLVRTFELGTIVNKEANTAISKVIGKDKDKGEATKK